MVELATVSVLVREAGDTHSTVVVSLIDGTELSITVNNNLLMAAGVDHRAKMHVECTGQAAGGKVGITLPVPHISHGSRVTVSSKYVERPNPKQTDVAYDTRDAQEKKKT